MWPKWKCPWCGEYVTHLGVRTQVAQPKWYQFTRHIWVCPHCNQPVRHSTRREAWLLLTFPLLLAMIAEGVTILNSYISSEVFVVLSVLAIVGTVMFRITTRLEKEHAN